MGYTEEKPPHDRPGGPLVNQKTASSGNQGGANHDSPLQEGINSLSTRVETPIEIGVFDGVVFHFEEVDLVIRDMPGQEVQDRSRFRGAVLESLVRSEAADELLAVPGRFEDGRQVDDRLVAVDPEPLARRQKGANLLVKLAVQVLASIGLSPTGAARTGCVRDRQLRPRVRQGLAEQTPLDLAQGELLFHHDESVAAPDSLDVADVARGQVSRNHQDDWIG
jgi:hypothetical protein